MSNGPGAARTGRAATAALLLCMLAPAQAQTTDPVVLFEAGSESFEAGEYAEAVRAFERARAAGLERPALYYNLGSSYFRLGRYRQAAEAFERLLPHPEFAALAHYNLGLVAQRTNQLGTAEHHFRMALTASDDERLRYLARRQIDAEVPREPPVDWDGRAFALAGFGYDDNVNLIPTDVATSESDVFMEAFAVGSAVLLGTRTDGLSLHGSAYLQRYDEVSENDYARLRLLGRGNRRVGQWDTFIGGFAARDTLAGDDFQRGLGIEGGVERPVSDRGLVALTFLHEELDSLDPQYDYLAGRRQEVRAEYLHFWERQDMGVYYQVEWNDREDTALESYSPTRHMLQVHFARELDIGWRLRADASYRLSDYPTAPALAREDDRWRTRLSATRELGRQWMVRGGWEYTANQSNDPLRDYERSIYSIELQWLY